MPHSENDFGKDLAFSCQFVKVGFCHLQVEQVALSSGRREQVPHWTLLPRVFLKLLVGGCSLQEHGRSPSHI